MTDILMQPGLNLPSIRQPEIGYCTLAQINTALNSLADQHSIKTESMQSNDRRVLMTAIQNASQATCSKLMKTAAYPHVSVALRGTLAMFYGSKFQVQFLKIFKCKPFHQIGLISPVCDASIGRPGVNSCLFGAEALNGLHERFKVKPASKASDG